MSSNRNIFHVTVTGPLWGESTGYRWIPLTEASNAEPWCFICRNCWANSRDAGNLRRHDVTVSLYFQVDPRAIAGDVLLQNILGGVSGPNSQVAQLINGGNNQEAASLVFAFISEINVPAHMVWIQLSYWSLVKMPTFSDIFKQVFLKEIALLHVDSNSSYVSKGLIGNKTSLGLSSLSGKRPYRQISWSLEAARLDVIMIVSLWNLKASQQHCCWGVCQISERLKKSKPESRGFEASRDLAVRRPSA